MTGMEQHQKNFDSRNKQMNGAFKFGSDAKR
jgi:hypothetical protein